MKLTEDQVIDLLSAYPGARRAAQGILVPTNNGVFHLWGIHSKEALDSVAPDERRLLAFCSLNEIVRMRNIRTAHDYLLRLRAETISASPRAVRVMVARKNKIETLKRTWSLSEHYHAMDFFQKSYIRCLSRANSKHLRGVPSGLALSNEANASCIRSFVGDIVICSEALHHFYYFMTIGLYGAWHGMDTADTVNALLIAVRIMNGSEAVDFDLDPRGQLPIAIEREINAHVLRQMQFTFGHEYAHYLCGHLALPSQMLMCVPHTEAVGFVSDEPKAFEHELEYEADLYAVKMTGTDLDACSRISNGAFSVLLFLYFLEIRSDLALRSPSVSRTHPKAIDRIWRLWSSLSPNLRPAKHWIDKSIKAVEHAQALLKFHVMSQSRKDLMTFYGSIYLPSYTLKIQRDRLDF